MADVVTTRRATTADFPAVLVLAQRALGWTDTDSAFLEWKHVENPFGESPMWVALDGDRVVGFRAFMRWEFVSGEGRVVRAVRAVDTATDPDYQGQGIFTRLTREAIEQLPDDGVELVFNTPNEQSRPGYLKMGWQELGRLEVAVRPTSVRFPAVVVTARRAATRAPLVTELGNRPADAFSFHDHVQRLLHAQPAIVGLTTRRTPEFLAWRYGHEPLGYRVMLRGRLPDEGLAVFRRRRRGRAVEGVLCELLPPRGDDGEQAAELVGLVRRAANADYLIRLDRRRVTRDGFVRLPRVGPVLTCRALDAQPVPALSAWALTMGDVELF